MFIQVFGDDAVQQFLIFLSNAGVSRSAPLKTVKDGNFVPSAFAGRQTETVFSFQFRVQLFLQSHFFYLCHPLL